MAAKNSPRPDHVFVGQDTIAVEWLTESEWSAANNNESWGGLTEWNKRRIQMRLLGINPPEAHYQEILLHEVLHAVWAQTNLIHIHTHAPDDEREEFIVSTQSPMLLFVLQQNPQLLAYLLSDGTVMR